ncbi:Fumarylacetoacetate hydrolase domain-containing protein 2-like protein 3 [Colletotrichum chlorophyti]|uniref:Fumarylacetoacetate hydrolase domain-containing protein 2-like protein 3 n=1 Tax=Colletotrichum chlorophyti TaxID=708187 RepID=A0A1Q8RG62_9PEZI|nr:Fumarylacetoacetate hydrolase domain-containing protein 2-like protein 3 [Colletotrichum chlorophyti]
MSWNRLIRFVDDNDVEHFGEPQVGDESEISTFLDKNDLWAIVFDGASPVSPLIKGERVHVKAVKPLLTPKDVPIIRCIGLNYVKHIKEGGRTPPPYPSVFIKPSMSVAAWNENVPVPQVAQDGTVDYEGELAFVIGKAGKNIPKEQALEHIAGYLTANDVSARAWQRDPAKAGGVPQWCFSKGFDKFAPLSPVLVSPAVVGNASDLTLQTFVNGEERQNESTGDLLFGVEEIVSFISQGTTLEPGTIVLTGTPSGVGMGFKPPKYLNDGDVVEVRISKLGGVKNKIVFE